MVFARVGFWLGGNIETIGFIFCKLYVCVDYVLKRRFRRYGFPGISLGHLQCKAIKAEFFNAEQWTHSLGDEYKALGKDDGDWLNVTHVSRMEGFLSFAAFVQLDGCWARHYRLWQSLLPVPGHLLWKCSDKTGGAVSNGSSDTTVNIHSAFHACGCEYAMRNGC